MAIGLFPSLLGATFERLDPAVREVHRGDSKQLRGTATITRGDSLLARVLCAVASLPRSGTMIPTEVEIAANGQTEQWTRHFGNNRPMRSRLYRRRNYLIERLGPAAFTFRLREHHGAIEWSLVRLSALGIPLPTRWFTISAVSGASAALYTFTVAAALVGAGLLIRYEGELDVVATGS